MNAVFCAKRERRGEEKNKAAVTSPLFWLFRPPTHTSIDWRRRCQKDQSKHDTLLENCHLSGYQKYRHQHKPQEKKPTRSWITCNNVRLSKAKVPFAQSKFSLYLSPRRERKGGKPVVQKKFQGHVSRAYGLGLALGHTCKVKPHPWYKGGGGIRLLMVPLPRQGFWYVTVFQKEFTFSKKPLIFFSTKWGIFYRWWRCWRSVTPPNMVAIGFYQELEIR